MKKSLVFILVLIISIASALAIETSIKQEYKPGETLIISIEGNFIENIKPENILFYSDRLFIPLIYDITKIQDKYYLYAILPIKERNYTLIIKKAHYYELGQEKQEDLSFNFSVKGNTSLFTLNPGFIIANKDFKIKITSNIKTINLQAKFLNSTQETSIGEGQTKTLSFSIEKIKKFTFTNLVLTAENTSYEIPIAVFTSKNISLDENITAFRFSKSYLNLTVLKDNKLQFEISLLNTGQEDLTDIEFNYSDLKDIISLTPEKIDKLEAGASKKINLSIKSEDEGIKEGKILATSENYTAEIFLAINTTENETEFQTSLNETAQDIGSQYSCIELKGIKCKKNEECDKEERLTIDGLCCTGTCKAKKEGSTGRTISIIIIVVVLLIIIFFIYRKLKLRKKSSQEILKEKSSAYEERFKPQEIRGGLTKV